MAGKNFTLYWSSLDQYEKCPQAFLWGRGWGAIDVGGGPGRPKPKPLKSSEHHAVMGTVIQAVLERMYNHEWWKHPTELMSLLEKEIEQQFKLEMARRFIDWRLAPPRDELLATIRDGVFGFLKTFKHNRLVGPHPKCEVDYIAYIDKWNPVGGRIDFLIRREDTGVTILDGKNSRRYKDKKTGKVKTYTDPDQLRWYGMVFYLASKTMPDRLGFVYYRYPWGYKPPQEDWEKDASGALIEPTPETGVEWVPFTKEDFKGLAHRAVEARKGMSKEQFPATPSPPLCKFCDYESVCPARQAQIAQNRRTPKNQEQLFDGATGFMEFGIGSGGSAVPQKG